METGGVEAKVQDRKKSYIAERKYEQVQCLKIMCRFMTIRLSIQISYSSLSQIKRGYSRVGFERIALVRYGYKKI